MKPERSLVAQRPLARHSAALLRPAPAAAELLPLLARAGDQLARKLRLTLAPLHGGEAVAVECSQPEEMIAGGFAPQGLVSISLHAAGGENHPLLSVVEGDTVLRLLDRAFGGPGEAPSPLPRELPLSAELMVQRIETLIAAPLAATLGLEPGIRPLRRAATLAELAAMAEDTALAVLTFAIREGARPPWTLRLGFPMAALADLTGAARTAPAPKRAAAPASPLDAPFAEMPLCVRAVLVDVPLPLSTLSALEVGQVLAVSVARSVPLRIGETLVGHGTIGAVDDRVALQLTQLA
ncbi:FliM/FliN family flagellar motor switch protein [Novosphingobium sp. PASSN1]|uniref:flagellar motor switch protein FliM n=1 Tax=Novosphingobium sp. PASSN1 TaxID=2015561 RepID=UPI000BD5B70D|nr:FliM/FliN family flagellar motor switch protein [Novosphingobium sp. PASSN1]OYU33971.1 MAG: flagellar switch protein [Novosphingobium sp. PASSN1]